MMESLCTALLLRGSLQQLAADQLPLDLVGPLDDLEGARIPQQFFRLVKILTQKFRLSQRQNVICRGIFASLLLALLKGLCLTWDLILILLIGLKKYVKL